MSGTSSVSLPDTFSLDHQPPPPETELNANERRLTPREQTMADIARRAQERRELEEAQGAVYEREAQERGEGLVPAEEPVQAPEMAPEPPPTQAAPEVPATPPAPPAPASQPALRTINWGGQNYVVTPDQYDQLAQMGFLAAAQMVQPQQAAPPAPPERKPLVERERLLEAVQKMQFGDREEAAAALGGLIEHVAHQVPATPNIDPAQIRAQAAADAFARLQMAQDTALIRSEFPAIFTDPARQQEANAWVDALRIRDQRLGKSRPDIDIYREAGNLVYNQHNLPRPGSDAAPVTAPQAAPEVQPRAGIEERKRAAPRNPQPVDRRAAQPAAPRQPTGSEIVAWMREKRHQAAMN